MHEGKKIKELLAAAGKTTADLGRAAGKTQPAAQRWVTAEELKPGAWDTCSRGLAKLGIDPSQVRAVAATLYREQPAAELRPLLNQFNRKQLEALKEILGSSPESQRIVRALVDDRLDPHRP